MKLLLFAIILSLSTLSHADVFADLARLYPEQSRETLQTRIDQLESPEDFYRSFTPYFHQRLSQLVFSASPWNELRRHIGWCSGDPHPENFGTLLSEKGKAFYGPNDFDDAHPCPQSADIFRFLAGWNLHVGEGATEELLQTYFKARKSGLTLAQPPIIRRVILESQLRGQLPSLKWFHPELNILRRRPDLRAVPSPFDREIVQLALKIIEGKGQVIQVAERVRITGGSGGVKRFIALIHRSNGPLLLEFKEIVRPAVFPWGVPLMEPFTRIKTALEWEQRQTATSLNGLGLLFNRPFFTRPIWDGHLTIDIGDLSGLEKQSVAHYQASLLGVLHKTSPIPIGIGSLDRIPIQLWKKAVKEISEDMISAYEELTGPIERKRFRR